MDTPERLRLLSSVYDGLSEGCKDLEKIRAEPQRWDEFVTDCSLYVALLHILKGVPVPLGAAMSETDQERVRHWSCAGAC
jgi:hypothetical protein